MATDYRRAGRAADLPLFGSALVTAPGGHLAPRCHKLNLVPVCEYIPAWANFDRVRRVAPGTGPGLQPGQRSGPIINHSADGSRVRSVGIRICYEDILPTATRYLGAQRPDLLANPGDDVWFEPQAEIRQHLGLPVFSAVEQRTGLIRAASARGLVLVDPVGRIR